MSAGFTTRYSSTTAVAGSGVCSIASVENTTSKLSDAMPSAVSVPTTARQPHRCFGLGRQVRPDVERDDVGACATSARVSPPTPQPPSSARRPLSPSVQELGQERGDALPEIVVVHQLVEPRSEPIVAEFLLARAIGRARAAS